LVNRLPAKSKKVDIGTERMVSSILNIICSGAECIQFKQEGHTAKNIMKKFASYAILSLYSLNPPNELDLEGQQRWIKRAVKNLTEDYNWIMGDFRGVRHLVGVMLDADNTF
jgi:hypothetical protein